MENQSFPKRFYKSVSIEDNRGSWAVLLDGRQAKTPGKNILATPHQCLAEAIAAEWENQQEEINPYLMPLTRRCSVILDQGEKGKAHWQDIILSYLGSDLLCYHAESPHQLVERQSDHWIPFIDWFTEEIGIKPTVTSGVMSVNQPEQLSEKTASYLASADTEAMSCIAAATEISGSAILALALWKRFKPLEDIFAASRLDETFQAERWGGDSEANEREENLKRELFSVDQYLHLIS